MGEQVTCVAMMAIHVCSLYSSVFHSLFFGGFILGVMMFLLDFKRIVDFVKLYKSKRICRKCDEEL